MALTKWVPSFDIAVSKHYDTRKASDDYLLLDDSVVPGAAPPLALGMPHSVDGGSIQADMRTRLTHDHALFQMDNDMLFSLLDKAVCDRDYANTIKPFGKRRDGHGAYLSILGNRAGDDKWDRIIETAET